MTRTSASKPGDRIPKGYARSGKRSLAPEEPAMNIKRNPSKIAAPLGRYTHSIEAPANARLLAISGQVGNGPDGKTPADFAAQAENALRNVVAILADAGMSFDD